MTTKQDERKERLTARETLHGWQGSVSGAHIGFFNTLAEAKAYADMMGYRFSEVKR